MGGSGTAWDGERNWHAELFSGLFEMMWVLPPLFKRNRTRSTLIGLFQALQLP